MRQFLVLIIGIFVTGCVPWVTSGPAIPPTPEPEPEPPIAGNPVSDTLLAAAIESEIYRQYAIAMERAGCSQAMADAWEDASIVLDYVAGPDTVRVDTALIMREVDAISPEIRKLCSQSSALIETAIQNRLIAEGILPFESESELARLIGPVYFDYTSAVVSDDSVRTRLRNIGAQLALEPLPVLLVVEGFADPSGSAQRNGELGLERAKAVINLIVAGGANSDCCRAISYGESPEWQLVPGAYRDKTGARQNRRVSFSLDYRSRVP